MRAGRHFGDAASAEGGSVSLRIPAILAMTLLSAVVADGTNAAQSAFPGKNGRIVYNVVASGVGVWISTISPDGTRIRRVISTRAEAFSPAWSADGRRIVFVQGSSIWRVNGDGNRLTRIIRVVDPESPAWSPNGTMVAFAARSSGGNFDIYVVGTNGKGLRRLTTSAGLDEHPSWSPDGKRIAYTHSSPRARPSSGQWAPTAPLGAESDLDLRRTGLRTASGSPSSAVPTCGLQRQTAARLCG
jgi:Tol biopolymer transport system component